MHARITTATISGEKRVLEPETVDEALDLWKREVAGQISERKGFLEAIVLVCRKTNRVMQIGLWETEKDMIALRKTGPTGIWSALFATPLPTAPRRSISK